MQEKALKIKVPSLFKVVNLFMNLLNSLWCSIGKIRQGRGAAGSAWWTLTMKLRIWVTMGGGVKILPKIVTGFPSNLEAGVARGWWCKLTSGRSSD